MRAKKKMHDEIERGGLTCFVLLTILSNFDKKEIAFVFYFLLS